MRPVWARHLQRRQWMDVPGVAAVEMPPPTVEEKRDACLVLYEASFWTERSEEQDWLLMEAQAIFAEPLGDGDGTAWVEGL